VSPSGALSPIGGELEEGVLNFYGTKVTWPELKCIGIRRTRIVVSGQINMSAYNFVRSGPKFTIFLFNARKIVLVNAVYTLSLFSFFPEIFALKLESCRKSHRFLNVFFAFPNFNLGEGSFKILDRDYKTERSSEHRAKFRTDQLTELGDYAREK